MATGIIHTFDASRLVSATGSSTSATIYFYHSGTNNLANIYTDSDLTVPASNPYDLASGAILPRFYLERDVVYRRRIVFEDGTVHDEDPVSVGADAAENTFDSLITQLEEIEEGAIQAALTAQMYYPGARSYVPRGLTGVAITAAGTGGTNGSYVCPLTGDNLSVDAYANVTVSGGAVTAVSVNAPGLYIGASPTPGTVDVSSIAGLTGATLTPTIGYLKASGEYYLTDHATDSNKASLFQNQGNTAVQITASVGWLDISTALQAVTDATAQKVLAEAAAADAQAALVLSQRNLTTIERASDGAFISPSLQYWPNRFGDRAWLNGVFVDIDSVAPVRTGTQSAAGGRKFTTLPSGLSAGMTVVVKFRRTNTSVPSGCLFDFTTGDSGTLPDEVATTISATSGTGKPTVFSTSFINKRRASATVTLTQNRFGAERLIYSVNPAGNCYRWLEGGVIVDEGASASYTTPTHFSLSARLIPGVSGVAQTLTNAIIDEVIVYSTGMSPTEIETLISATDPDTLLPLDEPWVNMPYTVNTSGVKVYPKVWYDPSTDQGWWYGRRKTGAQLFVDPAGGDFTFKKMPRILPTSGMTVFHDGSPIDLFDNSNKPSGNAFWAGYVGDSGINNGRLINEVKTNASAGIPGGLFTTTGYASALGNFYTVGRPNAPAVVTATGLAGTDSVRGHGVNRIIITELPNGNLRTSINDHGRTDFTNGTAGVFIPKDFGRIGATWDGTTPLANYSLQSFGIFDVALTEAEHTILQRQNVYNTATQLFYGDSLRNVGMLEEAFLLRAKARGWNRYIPRATYGMGGKGLNYHKEHIELTLAWRPHYSQAQLWMFEGGLDQQGLNLAGTVTEGPWNTTQLADMWEGICGLFRLTPFWIQSNYNKSVRQLEASPSNSAFIAELAWVRDGNNTIRRMRPDFFVEIMGLVQTGETDHTTYLNLVATDKWPNAFFPQTGGVVTDTIHPIWPAGSDFKTSAYYYIGEACVNIAQARGILPSLKLLYA